MNVVLLLGAYIVQATVWVAPGAAPRPRTLDPFTIGFVSDQLLSHNDLRSRCGWPLRLAVAAKACT